MVYPIKETSQAELIMVRKAIEKNSLGQNLVNIHTTSIAEATIKALNKRIIQLSLPNVFTTFSNQCEDRADGCVKKLLLKYNIDTDDKDYKNYSETTKILLDVSLGFKDYEQDKGP
jgi:hypothetical protein